MNSKKLVLLVDDEEKNIRLLEEVCKHCGYATISAGNGKEAIDLAWERQPDLILLDAMMPEMDGFEATEKLKSYNKTKMIPVIMITALAQKEHLIKGITAGVNDFLSKPIDIQELMLRMKNNLEIKEYHDFLKAHNTILDAEVKKKTEALNDAYQQIRESYLDSIRRLTQASEYRDTDTGAHISRISYYAREIAIAVGADSDFVDHIFYASPMHDVGKVGIPDSVLLKHGPLNEEEWVLMRTHTTIGATILSGSQSPIVRMAEEIALAHHERWNGKGYPKGLKGEAIPLSGRIVNIVDQYDALRSQRPYKPTKSHAETMDIISKGDGRTSPEDFDPKVLSAFLTAAKKIEDIWESFK
ncbi:MAG: response regulator [Nitrospirota bacterium]|nr:response regulator [Nitrospirota bacterium]